MAILLAYFVFVTSTLAVIATAWIGVAESGAARVHLQRASAIQQSYDASFMAEDSGNTASSSVKTGAPRTAEITRTIHRRAHAASRLEPRLARSRPALGQQFDAVALRGMPPPDDGH